MVLALVEDRESESPFEAELLKDPDYKSAKFTVNDDAQVHPAGPYAWATSTIKADMTTKADKRDISTFRWTVIFQKQQGKWLIMHEHVSAPLQ